MNRCRKNLLSTTAAIGVALIGAAAVEACPTCKQALGDNSANLVRGFGWSILFMMSAPFLILGGLGAYFYYEIRRARSASSSSRERGVNVSTMGGSM
jgi:hypothetical protein